MLMKLEEVNTNWESFHVALVDNIRLTSSHGKERQTFKCLPELICLLTESASSKFSRLKLR